MCECKIAEKLVELRTSKGITQGDLAKSLSVSNKTVSKWEKGSSAPDLSMVMKLAKYYGVTTDTLLGVTEEATQYATKEIHSLFEGLDRRESVLKAFEISIGTLIAMHGTIAKYRDDDSDKENVFPSEAPHFYRNTISLHEFFGFTASSENVNLAVMMLRNKADFAWMNDANKQKEIVKLFKFLSSEDTLSVLYFIHSTTCSENFTADYVAENTGIGEERVTEILDEFCFVGECRWVTAHLAEGEVKVYECYGDGIILSLITLAFEQMCGRKLYNCRFNGKCKMIGGKK